ncbi:MAG TPA: hypothetical protein VFA07_05870 [Chthonomonadaceae bacterium]|nr:hypothetical protein [Chthonomonadaceae bacterium]
MNAAITETRTLEVPWRALLLVGLSLSIGWGIRGNFGHEWGAALPGALAALAVVLLSGRVDWQRRIALFGLFGALGWALGGSMSYMVVIAYTHSGQSLSVAYGFACLFVIGFLWGAAGGAGTALPAFLSRERLAQFVTPLILIFLAWWADSLLEAHFIDANPAFARHSPLDWYDTNWTSALLALLVVLVRGAVRRRLGFAERLILAMAAGWWAGFLVLTVGLGLHMTPPRSDNWAGSLGMVLAMLLFFERQNLRGVTLAMLMTGVIGGLGFASATLFKLVEMKSGLSTNWHSILEQTYGFINGLGIAWMMTWLQRRTPHLTDDPPAGSRLDTFAVAFLLLLLPYMNLQHMVNDWTNAKAMPEILYFLTARGWFDLFFALTALAVLGLLAAHLRKPLPIVPASWLGKGQMLTLGLLWVMVLGNFMKALVAFTPQRLVTEGVIYANALLCTVMVLLWARESRAPEIRPLADYAPLLRRALASGLAVLVLSTGLYWGIVRALYGDTFAGYAGSHIRFGPGAGK